MYPVIPALACAVVRLSGLTPHYRLWPCMTAVLYRSIVARGASVVCSPDILLEQALETLEVRGMLAG